MTQEVWSAVDRYIADLFVPPDDALDAALLASEVADPKHAEIARTNIAHAGLADVVDLRLGRALDTLPQLPAEDRGPFDFIFIDADKPSYADYFA